ncbi:hypothetical protein BST83_17325 [Polaribacter filamentus]|uniref:Uncharacterized protein n=1 Tax=Polaribacter filamentus TaxID=53483 RepID=A0A2S7KKG1_9FLAO|nr:hypothetical protein BST83_17325 [Polaribacter filamentus]
MYETIRKRKALVKWILKTNENSLNEVEAMSNIHYKSQKMSSDIVVNSVNSESLTKEIISVR